MARRIGVLGGTFDPVHVGHLILAEQARETARLDEVRLVPAARPPHKEGRTLTLFSQRVEMLQLAAAGNAAFVVDELEKDRPGPSYTAETLEELARAFPGATLVLIVGSDCVPELANWKDPERIAKLVEVVALLRPGAAAVTPKAPAGLRLAWIQGPGVEISSRDLRERIGSGRSVRYLVPRAVEEFIRAHGLYGMKKGPTTPF
jgi:nicotinate-nucleotide adenylyltransferase